MREETPFVICSGDPFLNDKLFDSPNSLLFRNARIGHPVQMPGKQFLFLLRRQRPIIRDALILAARDEIEEVLLQIRAGASNGVDFFLPNHFRQRDAQFGSAHRASESDHHFSAAIEMRDVGVRGVFKHCRVEVPVMAVNKLADVARLHFITFAICTVWLRCKKLITRQSSVDRTFLPKVATIERRVSETPMWLALFRRKELRRRAQQS